LSMGKHKPRELADCYPRRGKSITLFNVNDISQELVAIKSRVYQAEPELNLGVDIWAAFYKAWLNAFLQVVPKKADLGHRMKLAMKASYEAQFWPYAGRQIPSGTISGWIERASLPTDPRGNVLVTRALRRAMVIVVSEVVMGPPLEVIRLAERADIEPPEFSKVVLRLGQLRNANGIKFTAEIDKALAESRERLTRLPNGYPEHLRTLPLAEQLRVIEVDDLEKLTKGDGLYTERMPYGPSVAGLAALDAQRVVLLGNPGSGKSTLLSAYCATYIGDSAGIALFVRLDDLGRIAEEGLEARSGGVLTSEDAASFVVEAWDNWRQSTCSAGARNFLVDRINKSSNTVIAFDGLDEVALTDHRLSAVREVLHLLEHSSKARLIVASRTTAYVRPFADVVEYFVARLDSDQLERFVLDWFSRRSADDPGRRAALHAIEDERIGPLSKTPVIAGIVCYVAEEEAVESTLFGLYRQYLTRYFRRAWRRKVEQRTSLAAIDRARATAQRLAWAMSGLGNPGMSGPVWLDAASLNWLGARTGVDTEEILDLYQRDGLLVSFGRPSDSDPLSQEVRWLHRTVHEHLVARHLVEKLAQDGRAGLSLLVEASLRPELEHALEHLAGGLAEFGILEASVDALWKRATEHDTSSQQLVRAGTHLLLTTGSTHRQTQVIDFLTRHHEWYLLGRVDPDALRRALLRTLEVGPSATEITHLQNSLANFDPPASWTWSVVEVFKEVSREFKLLNEWALDRLAWKIEPRRMFGEALERLARGRDVFMPWQDDLLTEEEIGRLVGFLQDELKQGNVRTFFSLDQWLHAHCPAAWRQVQSVAEHMLGSAVIAERVQVWVGERRFDWDIVGEDGRKRFFSMTEPWGEFDFGWDLGDRGLELPPGATTWTVVAHQLAQVAWTPAGVTAAYARLSTERQPDGGPPPADLPAEWTASPGALRRTLAFMITSAHDPTLDRIRIILDWFCRESPSSGGSPNHIHLDASWFYGFLNALPWRLQVEAGMQKIEELLAGEGSPSRAIMEWMQSALARGVRDDSSSPAMELVKRFTELVVSRDVDPQAGYELVSFIQSGIDDATPEVIEEICTIIESRALCALPSDSELLVSLLDAVDRARFVAGLLYEVYMSGSRSC
jgi:hypothetical protein